MGSGKGAGKGAGKGDDDGEFAVVLVVCVLAAIFAVPICNWLLLGKAVFAVVPQNCNMTAVIPAEPFPYATSQFYGELYGMTDLSLQKDWYYSPWILFPGIQGVCPFNPHITVKCSHFNDTGFCTSYDGGISNCWRPKSTENSPNLANLTQAIFARMDYANSQLMNPPIQSNMVEGYTMFRSIGTLTVNLAIAIVTVYGGFPILSCAVLIGFDKWEKKHGVEKKLIPAFLFPLATVLLIAYWAYTIVLWKRTGSTSDNPFFDAGNWLNMFPHCESVKFYGGSYFTDFVNQQVPAIGSFRSLEQVLIIFPPFLWLPGLCVTLVEMKDVVKLYKAVLISICTICFPDFNDDTDNDTSNNNIPLAPAQSYSNNPVHSGFGGSVNSKFSKSIVHADCPKACELRQSQGTLVEIGHHKACPHSHAEYLEEKSMSSDNDKNAKDIPKPQNHKVNSEGAVVSRGDSRRKGGNTGMSPGDLYYCGRKMKQCRCGRCDDSCGPNDGCPCNSCLELAKSEKTVLTLGIDCEELD